MPSPLCFSLHLSQASLRHAAHPRGHHCALRTDLFLEDITCLPPTSSLHDPRDQPPEDLLTYLNPNPAPSVQMLGPMPVFTMTKNHLDTLESQPPSMQRWKQAQGGEVASPKASEGLPRAQTQKPLTAIGTLRGERPGAGTPRVQIPARPLRVWSVGPGSPLQASISPPVKWARGFLCSRAHRRAEPDRW